MGDAAYDFAVLGSGAPAGLLAGLLASKHQKRVVLVGESWSPFRLQRRVDLSVELLTRPESLLALKRSGAEAMTLLSAMGKVTEQIQPLLIAETGESVAALEHFQQLAKMVGFSVEPARGHRIPDGLTLRLRDAAFILPDKLSPALNAWLDKLGVRRLEASETQVSVSKDGTARIVHGSIAADATQAVLADDTSIATHLDAESLDRALRRAPASALLLEAPKSAPAAPLMHYLDRGLILRSQGRAGLSVMANGDPATLAARLGATVGSDVPLRRAGETHWPAIASLDGAPFVGPARGGKALVVAGFGAVAAFMMPAVARYISGNSLIEEADWFAARGPNRGNARPLVADIQPGPA